MNGHEYRFDVAVEVLPGRRAGLVGPGSMQLVTLRLFDGPGVVDEHGQPARRAPSPTCDPARRPSSPRRCLIAPNAPRRCGGRPTDERTGLHLPAAALAPGLPQAHRGSRAARRRARARRTRQPQLHAVPARPARRRSHCDRATPPRRPPAPHRIPSTKTLEQIDFDAQPSLDRRLVEELATLRFIEERANVLAIGPPGVGKTMLAIALGLKAVHAGYRVYYTTAADLVARTARAARGTRMASATALVSQTNGSRVWS